MSGRNGFTRGRNSVSKNARGYRRFRAKTARRKKVAENGERRTCSGVPFDCKVKKDGTYTPKSRTVLKRDQKGRKEVRIARNPAMEEKIESRRAKAEARNAA